MTKTTKTKKNIYNDDILSQSYQKDMPYKFKGSLKKHFDIINNNSEREGNNNIFHDNHIIKEVGKDLLEKEILDDLENLIDSSKAKAWEIARYLKLKRNIE